MQFRLSEIAEAVGGRMVAGDPGAIADGVSIDSREIDRGMLFVPIVAERDGHDFVPAAAAAGAAAVIVSRLDLADGNGVGLPTVAVADTAAALRSLGILARTRLPDAVVGVTGSVGKTTTKDLLRAALAADRPTHANVRSFNNELGVPITLANAPAGTGATIIEMGARGVGHIRSLCAVARPTVGVVLAVAAAHTELFGDLDGVAQAKGELVEDLPASGAAVLNAADPRVMAMADRTAARVITFGPGGDVDADAVRLDDELRPRFELRTPEGSAQVTLPAAGVHTVTNACAAAAAALAVGADTATIAAGLETATISPWRMAIERTATGARVINDAYNANPASMHAAIDALMAASARRRVAVVGRMAELGTEAAEEHRRVGARLAALDVEVISFGVPEYGGRLLTEIDDALDTIGELGPDDVVLVKASRVAGLERLAARLVDGG